MTRRVTLVSTNQVKPAVAPIAFDYLHEPLLRAGFQADLFDLCFSQDFKGEIEEYCRHNHPDFWGVTLRDTDDVYFSSQHSFLAVIREIVAALRRRRDIPIIMGGVGFSIMPDQSGTAQRVFADRYGDGDADKEKHHPRFVRLDVRSRG